MGRSDRKKPEWPKFIADSLGIPPIEGIGGAWQSSEGTTNATWFRAMAEALGVPYQGNRVATMQALIESVGEEWNAATMSSELTRSKGGGNVRLEAYETLWRGMQTSRPGRNARESSETTWELFNATPEDVEEDLERVHLLGLIRRRQGQPEFRALLLEAYRHRCAITGCDVIEVLEAAHITPFSAGGPMTAANGILLRADIHNLFDLGLIEIDTARWRVIVHPKIAATELGNSLSDQAVRLPSDTHAHPSRARLDARRTALSRPTRDKSERTT